VPDRTLLSTLRGQLQAESERLRAQIESIGGVGALSYDENFADSGQVAAEQGETQAMLKQLREQLNEAEHALAKFDDDSYGTCERCGRPIDAARLKALPHALLCLDCKRREERGR
jgi:DnaK suppressor protein